jgi:hypothetical protein
MALIAQIDILDAVYKFLTKIPLEAQDILGREDFHLADLLELPRYSDSEYNT